MSMLDQINKDLQRQFDMHGRDILLIGETDVQKNSLGEVISATPTETPQRIIERQVSFGVNRDDVVTLPEDALDFIAPSDTLLVESSIILVDERLFEIKELRPRRVFGEIVCFIGRAERADGVGK